MSDIEKARREKQRQQSLKDQRDMTVEEWCEKRRLSKPTYYKLDRMGLGPEWYELLGSRRITPAADFGLGKESAGAEQDQGRRVPQDGAASTRTKAPRWSPARAITLEGRAEFDVNASVPRMMAGTPVWLGPAHCPPHDGVPGLD